MAKIDELFKSMIQHGMDKALLIPYQSIRLFKDGRELVGKSISAEYLSTSLLEITPLNYRTVISKAGKCQFDYRGPEHEIFQIVLENDGAKLQAAVIYRECPAAKEALKMLESAYLPMHYGTVEQLEIAYGIYEKVAFTYTNDAEPELQECVVEALLGMAKVLSKSNQSQDVLKCWHDIAMREDALIRLLNSANHRTRLLALEGFFRGGNAFKSLQYDAVVEGICIKVADFVKHEPDLETRQLVAILLVKLWSGYGSWPETNSGLGFEGMQSVIDAKNICLEAITMASHGEIDEAIASLKKVEKITYDENQPALKIYVDIAPHLIQELEAQSEDSDKMIMFAAFRLRLTPSPLAWL